MKLKEIMAEYMPPYDEKFIEEIRVKRENRIIVRVGGRNISTDIYITSEAFDRIMMRACGGSYHSHADTLKNGYIAAGGGIRIGVAGQAVCDGSTVSAVKNPCYMTIRVPHLIRGACDAVYKRIRGSGFSVSILLYSPPGVGKTTVLRDIAMWLTGEPYRQRVVILDQRNEIYLREMEKIALICPFLGYPKSSSMEAAVRGMSPDYIITDEIGSPFEAEEIMRYCNSGSRIIATAHASSFGQLVVRDGIRQLYEKNVFDLYCKIERDPVTNIFGFSFRNGGVENDVENDRHNNDRDIIGDRGCL